MDNYRFQPLPNLSSVRDPPRRERHHFSVPLTTSFDDVEQLRVYVRLAFAHIISQYLDSKEFVFAEIPHDHRLVVDSHSFTHAHLRALRFSFEGANKEENSENRPDDLSWVSLASRMRDALTMAAPVDIERTRNLWGLAEHSDYFPFPVIFSWDWENESALASELADGEAAPPSIVPSAYHSIAEQVTALVGFSAINSSPPPGTNDNPSTATKTYSLHASASGALFSPSMLETFVKQVEIVLCSIITNPSKPYNLPFDSLLPSSADASKTPLLSHYTSSQFQERCDSAFVPIRWLTEFASKNPDSIAHEIYGPDSFSSAERQDIITPKMTVSYAQLNTQSNRVARWLRNHMGIQKGGKVAVCLERDITLYVVHAAVWKLGAIYISVDPTLPIERKRYIAEDSGAALIIVSKEEKSSGTFDGVSPSISLNDDASLSLLLEEEVSSISTIASADDLSDVDEAGLDDIAYLLYTSGTTGKPKGCLLTHRGVYHAITSMAEYPQEITDPMTDKRLAMASIAFDVHISEIVACWALGIRLVSAPNARFELLADMHNNVRKLGITHLGMVPSMIEATFRGGADEGQKLGLKYLVSGGEKISDSLLKKWANHPTLILANFYGPTEATIGCTSRRVSSTDKKENIGLPFVGCRAYVAKEIRRPGQGEDSFLEIVPRGTPGELIIEGPLVGNGYHNNPAATRKSFIEWPATGCRAYRTGDLVRMMPDSTIEILGRIDTQIKLRGVRIEAEGISNVLSHAATSIGAQVSAVTIIAAHSGIGGGNEGLIGFIAPGGEKQPSMMERKSGKKPSLVIPTSSSNLDSFFSPKLMEVIKEASIRELANYMRPSFIIPISFIPLSSNGKTDNKILKEIFASAAVRDLLRIQRWEPDESMSSDDEARPRSSFPSSRPEQKSATPTSTESEVINMISKLTGSSSLRPESNLFEAGLDSLKFASLSRSLRHLIHSEGAASSPPLVPPIRVADLMAKPTVRDVAIILEERRQQLTKLRLDRETTPFSNESITSFCSSFDAKWRGHAEEFITPSDIEAVRPPFPVQEGVLFRSVQEPGHYVQHFLYRCHSEFDESKMKSAWEVAARRHQILRTAFVLGDTLLQVVLKPDVVPIPWSVHESDDVHSDASFENMFHAQWSQKIAEDITQDITVPVFRLHVFATKPHYFFALSINHAAYDGVSIPTLMQEVLTLYDGQALVSNPTSLDSILDELGSTGEESSSREFWKSHFQTIDFTKRPNQRPSRAQPPIRVQRAFDASFSDLEQSCRRLGVTFQALAVAAFGHVSGRMFHPEQSDSLFGVIRSGRSLSVDGADVAVCPLVCVVPTRVDLRQRSTKAILSSVQEDIAHTSAYEHTSLGKIQRWLGAPTLVDSLFSCRIENSREPNKFLRHISTDSPRAEFIFALELYVDPISDVIEARAAYTSPELDASSVDSFLEGMEITIKSLANEEWSVPNTSSAVPTVPTSLDGERSPLGAPTRSQNITEAGAEQEKKLWHLISGFLKFKTSEIAPTTSLVSLGLDSLRAVSLSRFLISEGFSISAIEIIQVDTIRGIAAKAGSTSSESNIPKDVEDQLDALQHAIIEELPEVDLKLAEQDKIVIMPATALQSGMLSQTLSSRGDLYVHAFTFRLRPGHDMQQLRMAWARAVERFDSLRTSFHFAPRVGRWVQVVHSLSDFKWNFKETQDDHDLGPTFVKSLSFADEGDFARSPLYFQEVSTSDAKYLTVVMHHALYDGASLPKLLQEVRRSYFGDQTVQPPVQLRQVLRNILLQEQVGSKYWADRLRGVKPWRFPRVSSSSNSGWRASVTVDLDVSTIQRACRRYQISPQCVGQVAWAKVLAIASGVSDVVFGQVVSGRALPGSQDVMAPVFNTIPCCIRIRKGQTNKELLRAVQQWNVDGLPWHHASLRSIQQDLRIRNLCDTLFLFQPTEEPQSEFEPVWDIMGRVDVEQTKTQYSINVEMHQASSGLQIFASCASEVMNHQEFKDFLDRFGDAIAEIISSPNAPALPHDFNFSNAANLIEADLEERQALQEQSAPENSMLESWSSEQFKIRTIVAQFTKLPEKAIHPQTDLASVGIDSISAIQISSLCRKAGLNLSSADVASSTTLADLADLLASRSESKERHENHSMATEHATFHSVAATIDPQLRESLRGQIEAVTPVTSGMEWLIGGWQRSDGYRFHHAFVLRSLHPVETTRIRSAWEALVAYHSILRSTFAPASIGGENPAPVLVTYKDYRPELVELKLGAHDRLEDELSEVHMRTAEAVARPPSVSGAPVRATIICGRSHAYIVINVHHAQYDAWSLRLLFKDFESLYNGNVPAASADYESFARHVQVPPEGKSLQKSYWESTFPDQFIPRLFPSLNNAPSNYANQLDEAPRTNCIFRGVLKDLDVLQNRTRDLRVPLHTMLLACWANVQAKWQSTAADQGLEAVFGLWHAGRSFDNVEVQAQNLAVPTINMLPIRVNFSSDERVSILEAASRLRSDLQRRTPLIEQSRLVDVAKWVARDREVKPLCNVYVNVLRVPAPGGIGDDDDNDTNGSTIDSSTNKFIPVKFPYRIPAKEKTKQGPSEASQMPHFQISDLVQDDILVDIFFNASTNSAGLAIECEPHILSEAQAQQLAYDWVSVVRKTLLDE